MDKITLWSDRIINHFWHSFEKAEGNTDILKVCIDLYYYIYT